MPRADAFRRGVSWQFIAWGATDALIALGGQFFARRKYRALENPLTADVTEKEARALRKLLWLNTALDVLYMIGGHLLIRRGGIKQNPSVSGNGWGILIQGAFLFFFDLFHALRTPRR